MLVEADLVRTDRHTDKTTTVTLASACAPRVNNIALFIGIYCNNNDDDHNYAYVYIVSYSYIILHYDCLLLMVIAHTSNCLCGHTQNTQK